MTRVRLYDDLNKVMPQLHQFDERHSERLILVCVANEHSPQRHIFASSIGHSSERSRHCSGVDSESCDGRGEHLFETSLPFCLSKSGIDFLQSTPTLTRGRMSSELTLSTPRV